MATSCRRRDRVAAAAAAAQLRFPVLVKPNVGGSGAGIVSFDSVEELEAAELDFGPDGTALVQERIPAKGESIVRVEILGGDLLYAIRILLVPGSFNLCPADYCELPGVADGVSGRGLPIEAFDPPAEVVADAKNVIGFDPFVNLVDLIVELADKPSVQVGGSLGDRAPGEVLDGALAARLAEARSQLGVVE